MAAATTTRTGVNRRIAPKQGGPVLNGVVWEHPVTTAELEASDVIQMGYLPAGATLVGFIVHATDMDTNGTPTLAWKITVGASDLKTGITIGQATSVSTHTLTQFLSVAPTTVTTPTLVSVTFTTGAATAAAGTLALTPVYIGN